MKPKRGLKHIIAGGDLLSAVLLVPGGQPAAFGAAPTSKILPVLEGRIGNPKLLAKTREKLLTLQDEEIEPGGGAAFTPHGRTVVPRALVCVPAHSIAAPPPQKACINLPSG